MIRGALDELECVYLSYAKPDQSARVVKRWQQLCSDLDPPTPRDAPLGADAE